MSTSTWIVDRWADLAVGVAWLQLHTGDPGPSGEENRAANVRRPATFVRVEPGRRRLEQSVGWPAIALEERYTHWSLWDDPLAGHWSFAGELDRPRTVEPGDEFFIDNIDITVPHDGVVEGT